MLFLYNIVYFIRGFFLPSFYFLPFISLTFSNILLFFFFYFAILQIQTLFLYTYFALTHLFHSKTYSLARLAHLYYNSSSQQHIQRSKPSRFPLFRAYLIFSFFFSFAKCIFFLMYILLNFSSFLFLFLPQYDEGEEMGLGVERRDEQYYY